MSNQIAVISYYKTIIINIKYIILKLKLEVKN